MSKPVLHWAQMKTGNPNDQQHVNMLLCSNANVWASLHPKVSGTFLTRLPMVPTIDGVSRGVGLARSCSRRRRVEDSQLTKLTELQIPTCDLHPQLLPIQKGHQWIKTLQLFLVKWFVFFRLAQTTTNSWNYHWTHHQFEYTEAGGHHRRHLHWWHPSARHCRLAAGESMGDREDSLHQRRWWSLSCLQV